VLLKKETPMFETEIARGMALLNARKPGWKKLVDTRYLDLGDSHNCVLGQVFGHYEEGIARILPGKNAYIREEHGFTIVWQPGRNVPKLANTLTAEWKAALTA
jgi:hypothetical protein